MIKYLCEEIVGESSVATKRRRMSDDNASSVKVAIDLSYDELMTEKVCIHLY